jgi:hypothetical protein
MAPNRESVGPLKAHRGRTVGLSAARATTKRDRPTRLAIVASLLASLFFFACEKKPEIQSPLSYAKDGISFRYPGNWSVTEDVEPPGESGFRYLFVESPGSATVIVQYYNPGMDLGVEEFAAEFHKGTLAETEQFGRLGPLSTLQVTSGNTVLVRALVGGSLREGVERSFSISAVGEQVPHTSRAFKLDAGPATAFVVVQAATEDWDLVGPGFDLVLESLRVE